MQNETPLHNISILLVSTKTPGNIGAVARCMMNTGLSRLILVRPPIDRDDEALKLAAGAESILEKAEVSPTLQEAIAGHGLVIGTSRHRGKQRKNLRSPREAAEAVAPLLAKNRIAIVFGREVNGRDREDLSLCHELVCIPSSDAFPSLNLSHAVMVVRSEEPHGNRFRAGGERTGSRRPLALPRACLHPFLGRLPLAEPLPRGDGRPI